MQVCNWDQHLLCHNGINEFRLWSVGVPPIVLVSHLPFCRLGPSVFLQDDEDILCCFVCAWWNYLPPIECWRIQGKEKKFHGQGHWEATRSVDEEMDEESINSKGYNCWHSHDKEGYSTYFLQHCGGCHECPFKERHSMYRCSFQGWLTTSIHSQHQHHPGYFLYQLQILGPLHIFR